MGSTERKQRQKEAVRQAILDAALKLVREEGWPGLTLRKVAEAIEYSVPVIYSHFENKEALLAEFTREGFRLLNEKTAAAVSREQDPVRALNKLAVAYADFAVLHKEYYQLMFSLGIPGCEQVNSMEEIGQFTRLVSSRIEEVLGTGSAHESILGMKTFWSTLHGYISINIMADSPLDYLMLEEMSAGIIRGLRKRQLN